MSNFEPLLNLSMSRRAAITGIAATFTTACFSGTEVFAQIASSSSDTSFGSNRKYAPSLPYTFTRKNFFAIQNDKGVFSDVTKGDYLKDKKRLHDANRSYRVFYWINEIPFTEEGRDTPADFTKVVPPTGCLLNIRKAYLDSKWVSTFEEFSKKRGDAWFENPRFQEDLIYKVAMMNVTT